MHLSTVDWIIIVSYLFLSVIIGLFFAKKASKSVDEYFVAGRSLPWYVGSVTMIASAFSIDTPLGITGLVAANGIQGVWYAWSFVIGGAGALGAFVFAALLRRSEVMTTAELVELRYDGNEAATLRLFKGVYFGIISNAITLGWIIKAVWMVTGVVLGWDPNITLAVILIFTLIYTAMAGMWGIAAADFLQFFIGIFGILVLTYFSVDYIGGIGEIVKGFEGRYGTEAAARLSFFPRFGSPFFETFIVFVTLKWWGNPPPAIHQRIVASKNERHASLSVLIFSIVHFAFNYWPMIIIAMVSLIVFPDLKSPEQGYPMLIVKLLPSGFMGLMLAAMMAAFMSTVNTQINYGASYMVNDIYRRFIKKDGTQRHYVMASRICTVLMLLIALVVAYNLNSVSSAWYFMAMLTAGYGFLIVARWFWWRINAWSEISAMIASGLGSMVLSSKVANWLGYSDIIRRYSFGWKFIIIVVFCTAIWVIVTIFTKPCNEAHLVIFCKKVKPFKTFWGPIKDKYPDIDWTQGMGRYVIHWLLGILAIFLVCFGIGNVIFFETIIGIGMIISAVIIFSGIYLTLPAIEGKTP
ncbi:MAG: Na+:solute symporter [Nitrospirae bacterium]|nr:Na+:solute symporter [Nitrospirota bacterium]